MEKGGGDGCIHEGCGGRFDVMVWGDEKNGKEAGS